ncbi:MAG: PTS sugar transporter subunit IIA, partial [bacterium]
TVLCFEWVTSKNGITAPTHLGYFFLRLLLGSGLGAVFGFGLEAVLRRGWVGPEHTNIFVLAAALVLFGICDALLPESGILGVIVAGMILAIRQPPQLKRLKHFKLELTEMGIGLLFILLSANLRLERFSALGVAGLWVVGVVVLVLRPLNVGLSTWGQGFGWREKLFLSWIAPRGIVAASMASLFVLELREAGYPRAEVLETFTYAVIGTTVLLQGLSAGAVARALGLKKPPRRRWLLVGEPALVGPLAEAVARAGAPVAVLVGDAEGREVSEGGVRWLDMDPLEPDLLTDPRLMDVGHVLAVSPNPHLNQLVCQLWREVLPASAVARWAPGEGDAGGRLQLADGEAWDGLATPGELAHGIESGTRVMEVVEIRDAHDRERLGTHLRPLLVVEGDRARLAGGEGLAVGAKVVVLRHRVPGLEGLVTDALIADRPVASLDEMLHLLLAHADHEYDTDQIVAGILARERDLPTTMGMGVVLPHTYVSGLGRSRCLIGLVPDGIPGSTPDGVPIRLVCLMLSPAGQAEMHLQGMGALARLLYDPQFVEQLTAQETSEGLLERVRDRE